GDTVPPGDRMTWIVRLEGAKRPFTVRFGPGGGAAADDPSLIHRHWADPPRFTAMVVVPAAAVNQRSFRAGDSLRLQAVLTLHGGRRRTTWSLPLRLTGGARGKAGG